MTAYMNKSRTDTHATPPILRDTWSKKYGPFSEFDPCPLGGLEDPAVPDGLQYDWPIDSGTVFVNPPYSRLKSTKKHGIGWVEKMANEGRRGRRIVALLPSRTGVSWFHEYIYINDNAIVVFLRGRIKFGTRNSAPFDNMLVIFG